MAPQGEARRREGEKLRESSAKAVIIKAGPTKAKRNESGGGRREKRQKRTGGLHAHEG